MPGANRHNKRTYSTSSAWARNLAIIAIAVAVIGSLNAQQAVQPKPGYRDVVAAINETMHAHHYNPAELATPEYRRVEAALAALGDTAGSDDEFINGFREIWAHGPFSHVTLERAQQSAAELADYLDTMRVGGGGAVLTWQGDIAVLTVNTMMGLDTIEEIDAAYDEIAAGNPAALIIDLRENSGGAFAVLPLVSHLLAEALDAGSFVSQPWYASHQRPPSRDELEAINPWEGWSIKAFWSDVQTEPVTRIRFVPSEPVFPGPVYVLTSKRTASAAELATDVLRAAHRAIIVGENTAGEMLSQKIYDVPGGFHLSLPVADYYSVANGRIEGIGIEPDIKTAAADALESTLAQIR